jgi:hypothetical protein
LFLLTFIRVTNYGKQSSGSLHSSVFKGKDPGALLLQDIRKLIKKMSGDPEKDEFCLEDGTPIDDGVTLAEYLSMTVRQTGPHPLLIVGSSVDRLECRVTLTSQGKSRRRDRKNQNLPVLPNNRRMTITTKRMTKTNLLQKTRTAHG